MTIANPITKPSNQTLLNLVGKPVFISSFREPEGYFQRAPGYYFIDSVIFHFHEGVEIGVSEYDSQKPIEQFDIDDSHISYFHIDDLELAYPDDAPNVLLVNNSEPAK